MTENKRLTAEELEAIRMRAEAAAIGKWEYDENSNEINCGIYLIARDTEYKADAEFIAHAREDVPKLLAEIERLQVESDYWRIEHEHQRNQAELYIEKYRRTKTDLEEERDKVYDEKA